MGLWWRATKIKNNSKTCLRGPAIRAAQGTVLLWSKKEMQLWLPASHWPNFQSWLIGNSPFWLEQFTLPTSEIGNMLEVLEGLTRLRLSEHAQPFERFSLAPGKAGAEIYGRISGGRANDDFALTLWQATLSGTTAC
jgi:hypothetical protein